MPQTARPVHPSIAVNGVELRYQGASPVKPSVTTEQVAAKTLENGLDEILLAMPDGEGGAKRVLLHGDKLDFSYRKRNTPPQVTVDGHAAQIIHFDDEERSFLEGAKAGFFKGYQDAFEALGNASKRILSTVAIGGGAMVVGGTTYAVVRHGGAQVLLAAIRAVAPPVLKGGMLIAAGATVVIGLAGAISGGFKAVGRKPRPDSLAGVIDETGDPRPPEIRVTKKEGQTTAAAPKTARP